MDRMRLLEKSKKKKNAVYAGMNVGFTLYIVGAITGIVTGFMSATM